MKKKLKKNNPIDNMPIFKEVPTVLPDGFAIHKSEAGIPVLNFLLFRQPLIGFEVTASYALPKAMLADLIRDLSKIQESMQEE